MRRKEIRELLQNELRELLLFYVKAKHDIIKKLTGLDYVYKEDIEEIKTWSIEEVVLILSHLEDSTTDISSCPWCVRSIHHNEKLTCSGCMYGKRHGTCFGKGSSKSVYREIKRIFMKKKLIKNNILGDCGITQERELESLIYLVGKSFDILLPHIKEILK